MRFIVYTNGGHGFKGIDPAGGPIMLPLKLVSEPTGPMDAVTRNYVDTASTGFDAASMNGVFLPGRIPGFTGVDINSAGGGVFTLSNTGVAAGSYGKVTVDAKGRVVSGAPLVKADIPALSWGKLAGKPTTLAGYGITDVVSLSGGTMTGPLTLGQVPSIGSHLANKSYVDSKVDASGGSAFVVGDTIVKSVSVTPAGFLRCNGGEVAKSVYPALYAVVGDKYGSFVSPGVESGSGKPWRQQYEFNENTATDITGWTTGTPLPATVSKSQAIVTKSRVYLLGGYVNSGYSSAAYTAPILADGTLGTWTTGTPLPAALYTSQAIVTKSRVYLLGGYVNSGFSSAAYTAPILADGTLGTWTTGTPLPAALYTSQAIVTKSRVYLLGGYGNGGYSSAVYTAPILADGTLGTWTTGTPLPAALYGSQAIVTKSRVYLLGGYGNGGDSSAVYTAPILADGTLGTWTTGTPLSTALSYSQAIVTKSRVYLLGGNGGYSSAVYSAPFSGGLNDYSPFYNGTGSGTDPVNFRLPDTSADDAPGFYSYIKH